MSTHRLDRTDRAIVNALQGGFPVTERPYAAAARRLGLAEDELIWRIGRLLDEGMLSRFGLMFDTERLGGAVTLCAMAVPEARFEEVAEALNARPEVAHNYVREHALNMWFVLAAERPERIAEVIGEIEEETGLAVCELPKLDEYFIGLKVEA